MSRCLPLLWCLLLTHNGWIRPLKSLLQVVSVNYIPERKAFFEPKLSKAGLMIARYFMKRPYEPGIDLGKFGNKVLVPKMKSHDTNFVLDFKLTRKDKKIMISQHREKRPAKAVVHTSEAPLKFLHISVTFPTASYIY